MKMQSLVNLRARVREVLNCACTGETLSSDSIHDDDQMTMIHPMMMMIMIIDDEYCGEGTNFQEWF